MLLYLPLLVIVTGYLLYWYFTRTFNYWRDRNVVSPPPVPLFGNIKDSALRKKYMPCILQEIYNQFPNEKVVGLYTMTSPCILIRDLDLIKQVMIKDFSNFTERGFDFSKDGLGTNLFHADATTWRILRARFTPMFTSGKLKNMSHLISERADRVLAQFEKSTHNMSIEHNILNLSMAYTISTIIVCAFGLDIDIGDSKLKTLGILDQLILAPKILQELDMMYPGIVKKLNSWFFPATVSDFFFDIVRLASEHRNGKPTDRKDFMDLMLEMKQQKVVQGGKQTDDGQETLELTDSIMAAQAFIFYVGGFHTSATTITYLLYELAMNPDVQDKVLAEIDKAVKTNGGDITYDVIMNLPYLAMAMDETHRKYPIVEPLQRRSLDDYKLPGMDLVIKKGQIVYVSALGVHYDETIYPNPETFDPERFTAENSRDRHPCAFLPFGVGPRNCIGVRFGRVQILMFVVKFLSKYRVEPSEKTPKKMIMDPQKLLLTPINNELYVNVIPRY